MNRREAIIDMLARKRAKSDAGVERTERNRLRALSTGLLLHLLDDDQLAELGRLEGETK